MNKLILISAMLFSCSFGYASDQGTPSDIKVEIGKVTEIVFPAKVSKIIKGGANESILVEVLDNSVYVLPKTENPPDIFVTTTAGISYPLNFHIAKEHDIKVQVGVMDHSQSKGRSNYSDVMDLMKDLMLDQEPAGATTLPFDGKSLLSNNQIELKVEKAYELMDWKAYILVARNMTNNAAIIPIEQMSLPGLLAVSSETDMLFAKGEEGDKAKVYLIVGK